MSLNHLPPRSRFLVRSRWDLAGRGGVIVTGTLEGAGLSRGDVLRVVGADELIQVIGIEFHMPPGTVGLVLARDAGADAATVGTVLISTEPEVER